jgi:hypothetical protein
MGEGEMVRQAMTFEWQALLSCEQARSCLTAVIPAKAGIHVAQMQKAKMDSSLLKAEHIHVLSPRARFRGNDGHEDRGMSSAA